MLFSDVTSKFMEMEETTKRLELTDILASLFKESDDDLKNITYLIQGKLAPDYENIEFGVSDKIIIKALSSVSAMPEEEINKIFYKTGDLGTTAYEISSGIQQKPLFTEELTVKYVYDNLTNLAKSSGHESIRTKINIYLNLLMNSSPDDIKYITRIITGKLRLGVADSTILDSLVSAFSDKQYSDAIENAYNFHPDIGYIALLLKNNDIERINNTGAEPLIPFKVMLAERLRSINEINEKMNHNSAYEYKYDGLRTQLHKKGNVIKIFSRGLEETTLNFPDIQKNFKDNYKFDSIIIDGESVPYNPDTGELYPFQMVSQRRGRKYELNQVSKEIPIVMFIFDILYLNGKSLVNLPYPEEKS